jgi:probable HAF family extracellular repeat protein
MVGGSSKAGEIPVSIRDQVHIFKINEDGTLQDSGALPGVSGFATGMNAAGQVIGWATDGSQFRPRAWIWSNGVLKMLQEGNLPSKAFGLNAAGDVVGAADLADNSRHAFLYSGGSMKDLGTLGGRTSVAYGINSKGQVVGWSEAEPETAGRNSESGRAFLYEDGQMKDLSRHLSGPLAPYVTLQEAWAINEAGVIVANGTDSHSSNGHVFLLTPVLKNP